MTTNPFDRGPVRDRGALRFEAVTKSYRRGLPGRSRSDHVFAAYRLDMELQPGDAMGVVGPNGAGKTTLLRLATGITSPDSGRVLRRGRTASVLELGAGLHPDLTGDENFEMVSALMGVGRRATAARRSTVAEFAGLTEHMSRPVKHYSSGMIARLSVSIALHGEPDLLLLDEVLSVGDLDFRSRARGRILELQDRGVTMLIVSHDLGLIVDVCRNTVVLDAGRIVDRGPSMDVIDRYVGAPAVNDSRVGSLAVSAKRNEVALGGTIRLECDVSLPVREPDLTAVVEMLMPQHPHARFDRLLDGPLCFAEREFELPWHGPGRGSVVVDVDATILPPGSYLARVILDAPGWVNPVSDAAAVRIDGPAAEMPLARIPSEWR